MVCIRLLLSAVLKVGSDHLCVCVCLYVCFGTGMGGHCYSGQGDGCSGFHSGHFVHMRGLPFRATEGDIAKVRTPTPFISLENVQTLKLNAGYM